MDRSARHGEHCRHAGDTAQPAGRAPHAGPGPAGHGAAAGSSEQRRHRRRAGLGVGQGPRRPRQHLAAPAVVLRRRPGRLGLGLPAAPGDAQRRADAGHHEGRPDVAGSPGLPAPAGRHPGLVRRRGGGRRAPGHRHGRGRRRAAPLAAHGYQVDEQAAGDDGFWTQFNRRELRDLPEPALPRRIQLPDRRAGHARGSGAGAPGRLASLHLHRPRHARRQPNLALPARPAYPGAGAGRHAGRHHDHLAGRAQRHRRVRAGRHPSGIPPPGAGPVPAPARNAARGPGGRHRDARRLPRRPGAHRRPGAVLRHRVPPVHPRPPPHQAASSRR